MPTPPISGLVEMCLAALPVGVFVLDEDLVFLYANETLAAINNRSVDDHIGHRLLDVLPDMAPKSLEALRHVMETGEPVDDVLVDRVHLRRRSYSVSYRRTLDGDGRRIIFGTIADVSARARAAELARNLGERLARLRDANVIGVMAGEETRVLDANEYVLKMLGIDRGAIESGTFDWAQITPPEFLPQDEQMMEIMRQHRDCPVFSKEYVHADGHRVPVMIAGTAFEVDPLRWVVLVLDTSTMSRSERRAGSLIKIATEVATARTLDDILALVPLLADPVSGLAAMATRFDDVVPRQHDEELDPVQLAAATGLIQVETGDPERGVPSGFAVPILDGSERVAAVVELQQASGGELDVHERSYATAVEALLSAAATQISFREQRRLAELAGALDVMIDTVSIETAVRDDDGEIVDFRVQWANRATSEAYGRPQAALIGETMLELHPELRNTAFFDVHRAVVSSGVPFEEPEFVVPSGEPGRPPRVVELRISKFGDGFISCSRDVTERAEAQREIRRSQQQLEAAQSLARIGSWEWNLDTDERVWSRELYRLLAIDPSTPPEERHLLARDRIHPDDVHLADTALARALESGGSFRYEQRLILPTGQRLAVVKGEVVEDERGRVFRGTLRDVTEWRRAQDDSAHGRLALEAMQRACLPASMPAVVGIELEARYRPAHEQDRLGGDWYDAFTLPDGRLGLVVGDVTGHGLAASAVMSQLRNALRAFASAGGSPADVLDAVARFHDASEIEALATCLYVVVDPRDGTFQWARAGHPPLVLVDGDHWDAPERGGGPPLGLGVPTFTNEQGELRPGGLLALYTDGLVEERGAAIDRGIERLAALLTRAGSGPVGRLVRTAVDELGTDHPYLDDVCLVVARWRPIGNAEAEGLRATEAD